MKRRTLILFWALLSILTGCSKELQPAVLTFSAETECFEPSWSPTKTTLADKGGGKFRILWVNGDQIRINEYCYTAENASDGTASFVSDALDAPSPTFCACYPYSIARWSESGKTMSVVLPSVQSEPASGVVSGFPMYAESEGNSLSFKNLCGLLKLDLKLDPKATPESVEVTSIKLKSDNLGLSGECEIVSDGTGAWFAHPTGSQLVPAGLTYTCNRTIGTAGGSFYIYLPQCDYEGFDIVVETDCGRVHKVAKASTVVKVYRGKITQIPLTLDPVYGGHEYVDLGLPSGLKWATMNVGATSVTQPGRNATWDDASTLASSWGGQWRVPTKDELEELCTGTFWRWTSSYKSSGAAGYVVFKTKVDSDKGKIGSPESGFAYSEDSDPHIFLPATSVDHKQGNYWSATSDSDAAKAYDLHFVASSSRDYQVLAKTALLYVRPVCP